MSTEIFIIGKDMSMLEVAPLPNLCSPGEPSLCYGERVTLILEEQKRSKAWLAEQIGISKQSMNYVMNHSRKPKFVSEIASALNVNPEWLTSGTGNIVLPNQPCDVRTIPILHPSDIPLLHEKKLSSEQHVMGNASLSENCFAIHLDNKSMEPLFKQGTILIFDPQVKPTTGDFVIFTVIKSDDVLFRQLFIDGADTYLKAVDPMYRVMVNEKIAVHGVLIESRCMFK